MSHFVKHKMNRLGIWKLKNISLLGWTPYLVLFYYVELPFSLSFMNAPEDQAIFLLGSGFDVILGVQWSNIYLRNRCFLREFKNVTLRDRKAVIYWKIM